MSGVNKDGCVGGWGGQLCRIPADLFKYNVMKLFLSNVTKNVWLASERFSPHEITLIFGQTAYFLEA